MLVSATEMLKKKQKLVIMQYTSSISTTLSGQNQYC